MIPSAYRNVVSSLGGPSVRALLRSVAPHELNDLIEDADENLLASGMFSQYGYEILSDREVRFQLFRSMTPDQLSRVAVECGVSTVGKPMDTALRLGALQWRYGSPVARSLADLLELPEVMIPPRRNTVPTVEEVDPFRPLPALHDYQEELVEAAVERLRNRGSSAFVIQLPTGAGKTRVMMEAVCRYRSAPEYENVTVVWLAHTEELCDQAFESFVNAWVMLGNENTRAIRCWGEHRPQIFEMHGNMVVGSYQKFARFLQVEPLAALGLLSRNCVLIADEAHKALARTYEPIVAAVRGGANCTAVGLTATPGRGSEEDSANRELATMFSGDLLVSKVLGADPIAVLQRRGILATIDRRPLESAAQIGTLDDEGEPSSASLRRLADDSARNELIVRAVLSQVEAGRQTLVFCCSVEHAQRLALRAALNGVSAAHVDCRMRRSVRQKSVAQFRDGSISALFNYGVLSTGFDAPGIECVVIARPTGSIVLYSQMVGRGLRGLRVGGTDRFVLIDVVDNEREFGDIGKVYSHFEPFWRAQE